MSLFGKLFSKPKAPGEKPAAPFPRPEIKVDTTAIAPEAVADYGRRLIREGERMGRAEMISRGRQMLARVGQ